MKSKRYPFPKPYSHNPWYRKWGQITDSTERLFDPLLNREVHFPLGIVEFPLLAD
jgi:hypothetical protein